MTIFVLQEVAKLLLEYGADANKRYFLGAEINLANDSETLDLLLTYGAHTETRDRGKRIAYFIHQLSY